MSKRLATSELNHDNWNEEEVPEEAGTFQAATPDVIQNRVIKAAKRRTVGVTDSPDGKRSAFAGFSGFKMNPTPGSPLSSPFSFLNHVKKDISGASPLLNGSASSSGESLFKKAAAASSTKTGAETTIDKSKVPSQISGEKSSDYYGKLKGLNESVSQWIKSHVDKNPFCILTPIFKDYEQYLLEIEDSGKGNCGTTLKKEGNSSSFSEWGKTPSFGFGSNIAVAQSKETVSSIANLVGSEGSKNNGTVTSNAVKSASFPDWRNKMPEFTFSTDDVQNKESTSKLKPIFSKALESLGDIEVKSGTTVTLKQNAEEKIPTDILSTELKKEVNPLMVNPFTSQFGNKATSFFGAGAGSGPPASVGFSFGSGRTYSSSSSLNKTDEDDYQPPKVVFTPVHEDGSIYSKRCKVFVKKEASYQERGVGTLFLKPLPKEEKTQLIVRADTSIGNLIINCLLSSSMAPQRMGSNNVMLICIPTPESKPPPVPVLLRVKTSDDADELLEKLKEYIDKK